mmetsp:Transcript_51549/g.112260  ORF Transcript_51549/g.112260 Transcript_51549/m.112260 type:complete len:249 (-) Transcript_51549:70-816(-)
MARCRMCRAVLWAVCAVCAVCFAWHQELFVAPSGCRGDARIPRDARDVARRAQILPALQPREEKTRKIYRLKSDSEMKEVAAILAREAAEGVATDSLGIRAANLAVKACATAGNELDGQIIAMAPQWISKTAHGRALEEGDMEVTALRIFYGLMTRQEAPEQKPLLVGRTTNSGQLAGAVLRRISQLSEAIIHVAGPERTMAALRATITAQRMLDAKDQRSEKRLLVSPSWQSDGPGRAYLRLRCFMG